MWAEIYSLACFKVISFWLGNFMYVEMKMGMNDWKEISAEFHDDSVAIGLQSSPSKALSYQFHPVASATSFLIKKVSPRD